MKIPTYAELQRSAQQLAVYELRVDQDCFAVGPPGTGKTVLAALRARRAAEQGQRVLFLMYGRLLRRYAGLFEHLRHPHISVSTYHSWLGSYWTEHFHQETPQRMPYRPNWEYICEQLDKYPHARQYEHVIVDEGQDLPPDLYDVLRRVGTYLTVFADEAQTITEQHSSLSQIRQRGRLPQPIMLDTNFRNTPEIAHLAHSFHQGDRRVPIPKIDRNSSGHTPQLICCPEPQTISHIAHRVHNRAESIGVILSRLDTITRFRAALQRQLPHHRVQYYSSEDKNEENIDLEQPGVTLLTPRSAKGLEFETVFACALDEYRPLSDNLMYVICSRARSYLFLMYTGVRPDIDAELPQPPVLRR